MSDDQAIIEGATPGEWEAIAEEGAAEPWAVTALDGEVYIATLHLRGAPHEQEPFHNAQFIARARTAWPEERAKRIAAEAENEALRLFINNSIMAARSALARNGEPG